MKKIKKRTVRKPNKRPVKKFKRTGWKKAYSPEWTRRKLINNATGAEKLLRSYFKQAGIEYIFQIIIKHDDGFYVGDFYLPLHNLVLEVDGAYHSTNKEQRQKDLKRTKVIKSMGYSLKRITNSQVYNWSWERILNFINKR
jgi:very-short-patch-repair endonuclease